MGEFTLHCSKAHRGGAFDEREETMDLFEYVIEREDLGDNGR